MSFVILFSFFFVILSGLGKRKGALSYSENGKKKEKKTRL
jgi:hypothetical protein